MWCVIPLSVEVCKFNSLHQTHSCQLLVHSQDDRIFQDGGVAPMCWIRGSGGLTIGSWKEVSTDGGCFASSCITLSMTGLLSLGFLGAGTDSWSLTEHTEFSNPY